MGGSFCKHSDKDPGSKSLKPAFALGAEMGLSGLVTGTSGPSGKMRAWALQAHVLQLGLSPAQEALELFRARAQVNSRLSPFKGRAWWGGPPAGLDPHLQRLLVSPDQELVKWTQSGCPVGS